MKSPYAISEKEFEVINIIASGIPLNQRELALRSGISLGMANLLLKRLVQKGYLRAQQLDKRKLTYLLTAKGFSEKAQKSYRYTLKTLSSISLLKNRIQLVVSQQHENGMKDFVLLGHGVLADLAGLAIRDLALPDLILERMSTRPDVHRREVCYLLTEPTRTPLPEDFRHLDLLSAISHEPFSLTTEMLKMPALPMSEVLL